MDNLIKAYFALELRAALLSALASFINRKAFLGLQLIDRYGLLPQVQDRLGKNQLQYIVVPLFGFTAITTAFAVTA